MIEIKDQLNQTIRLEETPKRIVSLVPSQTELLHDLGLGEKVVGITKFCVHPQIWFENKTRVGGTKKLHLDEIRKLNPDLIIANKEENTKEDIELLATEFPVYISDIFSVEDVCHMITAIGKLTNTSKKANAIARQVRDDFSKLPKFKGRALYFIWADPYMVVGKDTFIGHILADLGFDNAIENLNSRYEEFNLTEIANLNVDSILLSSEPFPFGEKQISEIQKYFKGNIILVDGEMFSWYGSRMLKMKAYFENLKLSKRL